MEPIAYDLNLLKIPVTDITKAAAFYRDALGLDEQFVSDEYGWAQFQAGSLPIALYKPGMGGGDGKIGGSTGFHLALPPAAFDALAARLLERGCLTENMIHRGDDGGTFVEAIDPDGNTTKIVRAGE